MAARPVTDEELLASVEIIRQHANIAEASRAVNIADTTLRRHLNQAINRGLVARKPVMPGFEITKVSTTLDEAGNITREHVQQKPERDLSPFNMPAGHAIKGVSAYLDGAGNVVGQWVKTKEGERDPLWIAEQIKEAFDSWPSRAEARPSPELVDDDIATIIPIADAHFGLYAWSKEAGTDYDLSIADETNRAALARLMAGTPASGTAVILGLGDLVHADNSSNTTSRSGNALDVDTRYSKVLQTAVLFMIQAVELALDRHQKVIFRNLPGNHDDHTAIAVSLALWAWYRDHPRVTVDIDPGRFWWWPFGLNLLGATHGDMAKMADLPLIMAASCPEDWGKTKYRLVMTGHIHHKSAIETGGVIVESFQSPAARDAWHEAAGYRSGRSLSALTFHKELGEIARQKVNIL